MSDVMGLDRTISAQAAEYAGKFTGLQAFFTRYRPAICPFEPLVAAVPPAARVFDIGSGNGLFLYILQANGKLKEGVGVDLARSEIDAGARALSALDVRSVRLVTTPTTSEWPTGTFDVVSMIDVMHHIPRSAQRSFFEFACARVPLGGRLIYKDMCRAPAWRAWANRLHDLLKARQWISYRAIEDIEAWALSAGFELVEAKTRQMYWYGHELRVFRRVRPADGSAR